MLRAFQLIPMVGLACLLAGTYGIVHNQVSYSVGPDYFHAFKFIQFRIPEDLSPRVGAGWVGWQASWWMGVVIGLPIALLSLAIPSAHTAFRSFARIAAIVVVLTLALGMLTLLLDPPMEFIRLPRGTEDPVGFGRAAMLHETSYLAGALGLLVGLVLMGRQVRLARRGV